jgi:hypothetical protein
VRNQNGNELRPQKDSRKFGCGIKMMFAGFNVSFGPYTDFLTAFELKFFTIMYAILRQYLEL